MSHLPALAWRAVEGGFRKGSERNDGQPGASRGTESGLRPQDHSLLPGGGAFLDCWRFRRPAESGAGFPACFTDNREMRPPAGARGIQP